VKLNYAKKHNFLTPYQKYVGAELTYSENAELEKLKPVVRTETHKTVISKNTEDNSLKVLRDAQTKLKEYKL